MFPDRADPQTADMTSVRTSFRTAAGAIFLGALLGVGLTVQEILIRLAGTQ